MQVQLERYKFCVAMIFKKNLNGQIEIREMLWGPVSSE